MQVVFGTKDDILIINWENDLMTIRNFEQKWFSGQSTEKTVTFPISSVIRVEYIEPKIFKRGCVTFHVDNDDLVAWQIPLRVQYKNRDSVKRLTRDLRHQINFT